MYEHKVIMQGQVAKNEWFSLPAPPPPSNAPPAGNSNDTSLSRGEYLSKNISYSPHLLICCQTASVTILVGWQCENQVTE